jgi:hypothetical protein
MKTESGNKNQGRTKSIFSAFIFPLSALLFLASPGYALTVEEILSLKKAGVGEETLQMLLEREREEKSMARRAGAWKLGDGRAFYTTEGAPAEPAEYRQEVYPLCIFPQIEVPRRRKK